MEMNTSSIPVTLIALHSTPSCSMMQMKVTKSGLENDFEKNLVF